MKPLALRQLYYHRDYDGVVAAAMVQASAASELELHPVQYRPNLNWVEQRLGPGTGIVDFLYHPEAALWVDHHATTFSTESLRQAFRPDAFHVFVPEAASCPGIIVKLPWFSGGAHWGDYVHWADVIDGANYASPAQANDLSNPHLLLSNIIAELTEPDSLAAVVHAIAREPVSHVLELEHIQTARARVLQDDSQIREHLSHRLQLRGKVAILDQGDLRTPYRRYLAYECYPDIRYGIGLYRSDDTLIVSVGENPWNEPGPVHLGQLCQEFGGGGRRATAGVSIPTDGEAKALASRLADRLNEALHAAK
ncbi:hypothetical protein ACN28I_32620 [Archangium gephyra]|uniref:hypothetical protein n=1 Tax=Archangium gephyra TaxID=48 RepID=UPI003B7ADF4A